jgi:hypothetical protein
LRESLPVQDSRRTLMRVSIYHKTLWQPANRSAIFQLANQWLMLSTKTPSRIASWFANTVSNIKKKSRDNGHDKRGHNERKPQQQSPPTQTEDMAVSSGPEQEKDKMEVKCSETGHYANCCPNAVEEKMTILLWDTSVCTTYHVYAYKHYETSYAALY